MFWVFFNFWTKIDVSGPYQSGHFLFDFEYFLKCLKYPSNFSETFKILLFHENNHFEEKKACFGDFSIFGKIAVSLKPYRRGHFSVGFEYFLTCLKYPSNSSEIFKILFFHENQSVSWKTRYVLGIFQFLDQNRCIWTITGVAISLLIFCIFWNVENTLPILVETFKILFFHENNHFEEKKACLGTFQFSDQNRCIRTLPAWRFFGWFWVFFEIMKIPFQFFWKIQNFVLSWKQSVWRKKSMFWGPFNFWQNRSIRTIPAWRFFGWFWSIFWNVENTLPILLKHSKFCSFMKTIGLKKKKHVLGTLSIFGPKSLYPDLTGVPFFGWFWVFFEIMKIPFQFFWNIQNFVLSWKQSVWRKKSMFWGPFNFWQNRCIRTIPTWRFFGWFWVFFEMLKIPFQFFWNIQNFVLSWKQSVWRKKSMFWGLLNFRQNRCIRTLPAWPFFGWFWVFFEIMKIPFQFFWNIQNFVLSWKQSVWRKKACFGDTFNFWTKFAASGPYRRGDFLVDFEYFLKCWKYPSNSSETFKILFFHENNRFEEKKACFGDFSIFGKIAVSGPYRRGHFFVDLEYFLKYWKYPFQFFGNIQNFVLSWKQSHWSKKKHVLGTFQFLAKSRYPDLTGMAIFWLILSIFWNVMKIPFQF